MERGKAFEIKVKELLEVELTSGGLGIAAGSAQIFMRKAYPSRDRGKPIVMDVSIEVFRQGEEHPWLVWVWECKDYNSRVPVSDVEEFHAKLEQIGLHNTKGTIACRHGFQEGASSYARAKGIGLVRILPDGSIKRLREAVRTASTETVESGLTEPDTRKLEFMFYGFSSAGQGVLILSDMLLLELQRDYHQN